MIFFTLQNMIIIYNIVFKSVFLAFFKSVSSHLKLATLCPLRKARILGRAQFRHSATYKTIQLGKLGQFLKWTLVSKQLISALFAVYNSIHFHARSIYSYSTVILFWLKRSYLYERFGACADQCKYQFMVYFLVHFVLISFNYV